MLVMSVRTGSAGTGRRALDRAAPWLKDYEPTNYIARSLLEAGGFRRHLHPDAKIQVGEAGRREWLGRLVESDAVSHALELLNRPAFRGFWP
jgi:hypothetical protein